MITQNLLRLASQIVTSLRRLPSLVRWLCSVREDHAEVPGKLDRPGGSGSGRRPKEENWEEDEDDSEDEVEEKELASERGKDFYKAGLDEEEDEDDSEDEIEERKLASEGEEDSCDWQLGERCADGEFESDVQVAPRPGLPPGTEPPSFDVTDKASTRRHVTVDDSRDAIRALREKQASEGAVLSAPSEVRRTPHMELPGGPPLRPGRRFDVAVWLDRLPARPGEEAEDFVLHRPADLAEVELDVWLRATRHFTIEDDPVKRLVVRLAEDSSDALTFRVAVVDEPPADGTPLLSASFAYNARPAGLVQRQVVLELASVGRGPATHRSSATAHLDPTAVPADLVVEVFRADHRDDLFDVRVATPLIGGVSRHGRWALRSTAPDLVARTMQRFFAGSASHAQRAASLRGAGFDFFEAAPRCFHELFWEMVDAGRPPRSVLIVSEERAIPWELMIPRRPDGPTLGAGATPLGVLCAVGRWHKDVHTSPRQLVGLRNSIVVAPRYDVRHYLRMSESESSTVLNHYPGNRFDPATFDNLESFFNSHQASLLHVVAHGAADQDGVQAIFLEGQEILDAQQLPATALASMCRSARPFVFLNACEVGLPVPGLVSVESFAKSFIEEGASCVIAPLWSVDDQVAHEYAGAFYKEISGDPSIPFADVVRRLRSRAYEPNGEDTFAAYCFYGDPLAHAGRRPE